MTKSQKESVLARRQVRVLRRDARVWADRVRRGEEHLVADDMRDVIRHYGAALGCDLRDDLPEETVRAFERRCNTLCLGAMQRWVLGPDFRFQDAIFSAAGEDEFEDKMLDMFDAAARQAVEELVGAPRN